MLILALAAALVAELLLGQAQFDIAPLRVYSSLTLKLWKSGVD